jgi:hypothetical protein
MLLCLSAPTFFFDPQHWSGPLFEWRPTPKRKAPLDMDRLSFDRLKLGGMIGHGGLCGVEPGQLRSIN